MKKSISIFVMALALSFGFQSAMASGGPGKKAVAEAKKELTTHQQQRLDEIIARVNEIKDMDKSNLSRAEKKELKTELKSMKTEARAMGGGIYLSVGAIIIIILLLILIL